MASGMIESILVIGVKKQWMIRMPVDVDGAG